MNNEQILKKAIEKVVNNGWMKEMLKNTLSNFDIEEWKREVYETHWLLYRHLIFSPEFAEAFWGKQIKERYKIDNVAISYEEYIWQLMLMVRYSDPIKYLEKFL